jgi:formylglycine-generating enzyme required for sulfatase activity
MYQSHACNGVDIGGAAAWPSGSTSTCQGGYPGVFDMSGNVLEWVDSCDKTAGAGDNCMRRGGSFSDPARGADASCTYAEPAERGLGATNGHDIGFRCCASR